MTAPEAADVQRAGDTVAALNSHIGNGPGTPWTADELRGEAEYLAAEAAEAAERETAIAQLATDVFETVFDGKLQDAAPASQVFYRDVARHLVDAGWRKDGDA